MPISRYIWRLSQVRLCLRPIPRPLVQLAEAEVAVGDERAHAEVGRQRHRLVVAVYGRLDLRGIRVGRKLGKEAQRVGFEAPVTPLADEAEPLCRVRSALRG